MVYEYAIDPTSLTNFERLRFIADGVGADRGRLIADFPKSWRTTVGRSLNGQLPLERQRREIQYNRIKANLIPSAGRTYDGERDWLSNAESAQESIPFRAIVAAENPRRNPTVLRIDDIDGTTELWKTSHSLKIRRDAVEMAKAASLLLQIASDVVLVDPNFKPNSKRFLRPFEHILQHCASNRSKLPPRIRLIVEDEEYYARPGDTFEQNFCNVLAPLIPKPLHCELVRVREKVAPSEKLHNRYVLTDWGGIDFGIGLDDDQAGGQSDDVHLLEKEHFDERWRQYAMMEGFDQAVPPAKIAGTRETTTFGQR